MRNIRTCETAVMEVLKSIRITREGKTSEVPVLYADREKIESYVTVSTKADGVIELKNNPMKLPVLGIIAKAITRNRIEFDGWIFTMYRQDLNQIIEQLFCLEVADNMGNNNLTVYRVDMEEMTIGVEPVRVVGAKFTATLNM